MINRIVVATDGSAASNRAVALASDIAVKHEASLYLLNVVRDMQLPMELTKLAKVEKLGQTRQDVLDFVANQILGQAEQRAKSKGLKAVKKLVAQGDPASEIMKYAKRNNADLIVIGTRGLGKMKTVLLGSVSRKVANSSGVNTLIVR